MEYIPLLKISPHRFILEDFRIPDYEVYQMHSFPEHNMVDLVRTLIIISGAIAWILRYRPQRVNGSQCICREITVTRLVECAALHGFLNSDYESGCHANTIRLNTAWIMHNVQSCDWHACRILKCGINRRGFFDPWRGISHLHAPFSGNRTDW